MSATAYHRGKTLSMDGYVSPAPALPDKTWRWQRHVLGNGVLINGVKEGRFRISYRMRTKGYFFARAYYYGSQPRIVSQSQHFRVAR